MLIQISEIKVNPGRREAAPGDVKELADSILEVGLINPIMVDQSCTLIAGLHRLEAVKLLGRTEIECTVSDLDGLQVELAEIDENFVRKDLSDDEFRELLLRRKEIYVGLNCSAKSIPQRKTANPETLELQGFPGCDFCRKSRILFPLIQTQFLIFPLIPMLYGFYIPACSANCSADLKENRRRAEQATFPLPALSALYPYYFFLSSSFCMLFSSLFAISLPYLSI